MGSLKYLFIAGAAALLIAGLLLSPTIFWRRAGPMQLALGVTLGVLASVALYGVLRWISAR
jgi:hypothetical protein